VRRTNELKGDPFTGVAIGTCLMLWMVLTVGCNIVGDLMYYIVPKFKVIFTGFGSELPGITVLLINASDFVVNSGVLVLLPPLSLLLLWTCGEAFFRGWSETWLAWMVGTGRRAEIPRMLRRLRNALAAHQPWTVALKPMVLNHHRPGMRVRLERVLGRVTAGMSIWPSLRVAGLLTFVPLLHSVHQQQRATEQHLLALREAENVLELLSQRPWMELSAAELSKLKLADDVKARLPRAALQIEVDKPAEQPPSKRLAVRVSWTPRGDRPAQTVRLVAWVTKKEVQP
jgi:hypothetical protein